uniref:Uncharacterized protein n=1 Tax=Rhizophora mucronata TaxID=61149 RepID=A0A2P2PD09_RHIMU
MECIQENQTKTMRLSHTFSSSCLVALFFSISHGLL